MTRITFMILLMCGVVHATMMGSDFFNSTLTGWYVGYPASSTLGPMTSTPIVWSIRPLGNDDWFMEDAFPTGLISSSHQQFWVTNQGNSIMYCGLLRNFLPFPPSMFPDNKVPDASVLQEYVYRKDQSNADSIVWCAKTASGGCELFKWTMTKLNETAFHMVVMLNPPVIHVDVVFVKQGTHPDAGYVDDQKEDRKTCQMIASERQHFTWNQRSLPADNILTRFRSSNVGSLNSTSLIPKTRPEGLIPNSDYSNCFVLNNETQFTLKWNYFNGSVELEISARVEAANSWVALGFFPQWPGMLGGKIVLGDGQFGVRQMIATTWNGMPEFQNWTTLSDTSSMISSGYTFAKATFPLPLMGKPASEAVLPGQMMWAFGETVGGAAIPMYHGYNRGMFLLMDWANPTFPEWIRCQ